MPQETLSLLHLIHQRVCRRPRGNHETENEKEHCPLHGIFFLEELDIALTQIKVQFRSYFMCSFPNPCETPSSPSPYTILLLFESCLSHSHLTQLYCQVVWNGPTIKASPVSYFLQQGRNPRSPFYFSTSKSTARRLCAAIYSTELKAFI